MTWKRYDSLSNAHDKEDMIGFTAPSLTTSKEERS